MRVATWPPDVLEEHGRRGNHDGRPLPRYIGDVSATGVWAPELLREQERRLTAPPGCTLVHANATLDGTSPPPGRLFDGSRTRLSPENPPAPAGRKQH